MAKPISLSPHESAALAAARRALARGDFAEVAARYEQPARARDKARADGTRHWRRALDFWVASGQARSGLACARRLLAKRLEPRERGQVVLAGGQLHLMSGRPRQAGREFAKAARLLAHDRDRKRQAIMGEAEARIALGDAQSARALLTRCLADAERSGDAWAACSAALRLGTLALWPGDPLAARESLEEVRTRAAARHLQSLEAEASAALAEAELALGRSEQAQREAEHAAHVYRVMERDRDADFVGRLEAAAIAARLAGLDPRARESAGPVLWREAFRKLAKVRAAIEGRPVAEAEILLQEATLLATSSRKRAAERVRRARAIARSLAPPLREFLLGTREHAAPANLPEEPEPRVGALMSVLAKRRTEHEREVARVHGRIPLRAPVRASLGHDPDLAQLAIRSRVLEIEAALGTLPRLRPDERLVVFAKRG